MRFDENTINGADFQALEDQAIDGLLDYDDYPPEEYRYFSKLARLGYNNRHKGWTKETCELRQQEYRKELVETYKIRDERLTHMKRLQGYLIRSAELSRKLYKARSGEEALDIALELTEQLLEQPGLKQRIENNLRGA